MGIGLLGFFFFGVGVGGSLRSDNFKIHEISVSYLVGPEELTEIMICWFNILIRVTDL